MCAHACECVCGGVEKYTTIRIRKLMLNFTIHFAYITLDHYNLMNSMLL